MEESSTTEWAFAGFNVFKQASIDSFQNQTNFKTFLSDNISSYLLHGETIEKIEGGSFHTLCLTNKHRVLALGRNNEGQLGYDERKHKEYIRNLQEKDDDIALVDNQNEEEVLHPKTNINLYDITSDPIFNGIEIISIACGREHSILLSKCGHVFGMGSNSDGQLGVTNGNTLGFSFPFRLTSPKRIILPIGEEVKWVGCGQKHTIMMTNKNHIYTMGNNEYGQLGLPDSRTRYLPTRITCLESEIIDKIVVGGFHNLFITKSGKTFVNGRNLEGQLGLSNSSGNVVSQVNIPIQLNYFDNEGKSIKSVACGEKHTLFLTKCGNIYTCGHHYYGQLALGNLEAEGKSQHVKHVFEPRLVTYFRDNKIEIESISSGSYHSIFNGFSRINKEMVHFACGFNQNGQLAVGHYRNESLPQVIKTKAPEKNSLPFLFSSQQLLTSSNSSCTFKFFKFNNRRVAWGFERLKERAENNNKKRKTSFDDVEISFTN
ncbi:hypothetical protein ABK040_005461 [Willaertia magna]